MMTKEEYIQELEFVLETEDGELSPETELKYLDGWDSTGQLGMVALLDRLGAMATVTDIRACQTVADLIRLAGDAVQ